MSSLRNLLAATAAAVLAASCTRGGHPTPPTDETSLLLISLDTLRADRLGCYGYERGTTPALDRFAARGARFERVIAESSWTVPTHVTLFTGLYPTSHGVHRPDLRLADETLTLAEALRAKGYRTFAITAGGWMRSQYGFGRGFETFLERPQDLGQTLEEVERLVDGPDRRPFFGFVHTYDVHCPYDPPGQWLDAFASAEAEPFAAEGGCGKTLFDQMDLTPAQVRHVSDRYDAGVRWVDDALAPFFESLEAKGLFETTVVVVTSDHGDELGEHGRIGHGQTLFREVLEVPLLVRAPGLAPQVVAEPAGLVDVMPTVLGLLDVDPPPRKFDGRSFAAHLRGGDSPPARAGLLSELYWNDKRLRSWTNQDVHLIFDGKTNEHLFFDVQDDPDQLRPGDLRNGLLVEHQNAFVSFTTDLDVKDYEKAERVELLEQLKDLQKLGY